MLLGAVALVIVIAVCAIFLVPCAACPNSGHEVHRYNVTSGGCAVCGRPFAQERRPISLFKKWTYRPFVFESNGELR